MNELTGWTIAIVISLALATSAASAGTVANLQIRSFGAPAGQRVSTASVTSTERHVLTLQATAALAFDVVEGAPPGEDVIRLYGATLGDLPESGDYPFGTLAIEDELDGNLLVRIVPNASDYSVEVRQGRHPNIVRIEVTR